MTDETDDGEETLAELFKDVWVLADQVAGSASREEIERRWQELLECVPQPVSRGRVRIIVDVDLGDPDISTNLTVRPPVPLMTVASTLRLLAEAIETGQINSLQLPRE